ncbi:hypothetical protein J6590_038840 [Homalodisca vitripennis]|nr:hypothetical protein J6590_038840 [Homalodisca vitripennis]
MLKNMGKIYGLFTAACLSHLQLAENRLTVSRLIVLLHRLQPLFSRSYSKNKRKKKLSSDEVDI